MTKKHYMFTKNNFYKIALLLILSLALFVRLYKPSLSPSLNWDEAAAGYNAYSIAKWGQDEWGETMPLVFKSFRDDKHPVHIYTTAIFYTFFGKSDFVTRLPSAVMGSLFAIALYFVGKYLFESRMAGLLASLFAALSLYSIHYSRGLWEANFAIFYFTIGFALFLAGIKKKNHLLSLSSVAFGLSLLSYHSAKVVVIGFLPLLYLLHFNKLLKLKKLFASALLILGIFLILFVIEPRLLGLARVGQTGFSEEVISGTYIYPKTQNKHLAQLEIALKNEVEYFSIDYLLIKGDQNPRGFVGRRMFYYSVIAVAVIGIISLIYKKKFKILTLLLAWAALAPLPGALSTMDANATRGIFMLGVFELLAAYGLFSISKLSKQKFIAYGITSLILGIFLFEALAGYKYYLKNARSYNPHDWQYGMEEVINYVDDHAGYREVYMTKDRSQPYIFFLYYLDYPLPEFLETVAYDTTESKSFNTVSSFGKFNFGNWDEIESAPIDGVLYIVTPSKYSGLRYRDAFSVQKQVQYFNGSEAFYLVSTY